MPASFEVASSTGTYGVSVAAGSFHASFNEVDRAFLLVDEFFRHHLSGAGAEATFLEASELEKSLDRIPRLVEGMRLGGANRGTQIIAIGGGIIQDIAAFVASIYMRGLRWTYVPTTVLAMVDSCIGGKSSINVGSYKNLVGTFHPPQHIHIDPTLAETLPREQFASGLIEAAKICFCRGPESFARYLSHEPSHSMSSSALEQVIIESLHAKKHFIEIDEFDQNERLLLNFGHTFGHAIEGASHYAIPHGIAVGIGILCSLRYQSQRGLQVEELPQVKQLREHLRTMVDVLPAVGDILSGLRIEDIMKRFASDKKHSSGHYTLVLVSESGAVHLDKIGRTPAADRGLQRAIESTIGSDLL